MSAYISYAVCVFEMAIGSILFNIDLVHRRWMLRPLSYFYIAFDIEWEWCVLYIDLNCHRNWEPPYL